MATKMRRVSVALNDDYLALLAEIQEYIDEDGNTRGAHGADFLVTTTQSDALRWALSVAVRHIRRLKADRARSR